MKKSVLKRCFAVLLVLVLCFVAIPQNESTSIKAEAKTVEQLEKEIQALKKKQQQYNSMISSIGSDINQGKQKQGAINNQISTTQSLVASLNTQITTLQNQITTQEGKIKQQQGEIDKQVEAFQQRVRAMYLAGNDSVAAVLLNSSDFFDMLMKLELIQRVSEHDNQMITQLIALKKEYEATKLSLQNNKKALESSKAEHDKNLTGLNSLYDQTAEMVAFKQKQQSDYQSLSAAQKAAIEKAEREVDRILAEEALKNGGTFTGNFTWPLPGYKYITSYFGWRTLWGRRDYHRGIDISGSYVYGKPIVAAASGKVVIEKTGHPSYGNYVAIAHGSGFTTLYAHSSRLNVKVGQYVKAGDVIAYIGSTGNSSGAHLHFEVQKNGQLQNPLNYVR